MVTSSMLSGAAFLAMAGILLIYGMVPAGKGNKPGSPRARAARLAFVAVLLLAGVVTMFPSPAERAFLTQAQVWLELPARALVRRVETLSPTLGDYAVTPLTALMCATVAFILGGIRSSKSPGKPARA
jgi:hypothetical protein